MLPIKYVRKKPIVVEAVRASDVIAAAQFAWQELPAWIVTAYDRGDLLFPTNPLRVEVYTPDGWEIAGIDDWIISETGLYLYPCQADVFAATYDPVYEPQWLKDLYSRVEAYSREGGEKHASR